MTDPQNQSSPELARRRAAMGVTADDDAAIAKALQYSGAGRKRNASGAEFEAELDFTHSQYRFRRWGNIRRNHVPTRMVGRGDKVRRIVAGAAHVDRSGWVCVKRTVIPTSPDDARIELAGASANLRYANNHEIIPVAFDAKVLRDDHSTYHHEKSLQHQLEDLKAAAEAGEHAFLLVLARQVDRVFAIPILKYHTQLLGPRGVTLWETNGRDRRLLLPSIGKSDVAPHALGWDWIPLLHHCDPTRR